MAKQDGILGTIEADTEIKIGDVLRLVGVDSDTQEVSASIFSDCIVTEVYRDGAEPHYKLVRPLAMVRSIGISHTAYVSMEPIDKVPHHRLQVVFRRVLSSRGQPCNVDH
jgi:hypothetical protein